MSTTVWVRVNPAATNASALLANDAVPNVTPLVIRIHPSNEGEAVEDFSLPYNPIQVNYGDLADEITQIPRPATTPIVAFKAHRLMTVDMTFIVAQPGDGLATSVDDQLQTLRRFAASGHRVISLINFDSLTNSAYQYRNLSPEQRTDGLFFNIVEFSIQSVRRNKLNQISQASVTMNLVENRNPRITVISIPPLPKFDEPKCCKKPKNQRPKKCVCGEMDLGGTPPGSSWSERARRTAETHLGWNAGRANDKYCIYSVKRFGVDERKSILKCYNTQAAATKAREEYIKTGRII